MASMNTQLFTGSEPSAGKMAPIRNEGFIKPRGGLWTSSYDAELGSDWIQWCQAEDFQVPRGGWPSFILEVDPNARILTIDSYEDLASACERYAITSDFPITILDFERMAQDYDAMHLTATGQMATRLTHPVSLYGWDCESTIWFRWMFTSVTNIGRQKYSMPAWEYA